MLKKVLSILIAIILVLPIVACGAKASEKRNKSMSFDSTKMSVEPNAPKAEAQQDGGETGSATLSISPQQFDRKIIFDSMYDIQTKDFEKTIAELNKKIEQTKSYVQNSNTSGDIKQGNAVASISIRVPSDKYNNIKSEIAKLGNVISSSENTQDVTGDYFDKDARIAVLKAQEKRVLELLDKAAVIEDILKIESELTKIRAEIEQLTTVIKRYDDLISYSTVTVNIYQTSDYINKDDGFFSKLAETIKNSFKSVVKALQYFIYGIVWVLPYAVIAAVIFFIVRAILKKKKTKLSNKSLPPQ